MQHRRCASIRAARLGQCQSCSSARPKPTPTLTMPNPDPNRNPPGGSRSAGAIAGSAACFDGVYPKTKLAGRKSSIGQSGRFAMYKRIRVQHPAVYAVYSPPERPAEFSSPHIQPCTSGPPQPTPRARRSYKKLCLYVELPDRPYPFSAAVVSIMRMLRVLPLSAMANITGAVNLAGQ